MSKHRRSNDSETKHHRLPKAENGETHPDNISYVPFDKHMAYNKMFNDGHLHPTKIAKELTDIWIRPDWVIIAIPRCETCLHCFECKLEVLNGTTPMGTR